MKRWTIVGALLLAAAWSAGIYGADFDGDGVPDLAVFRPASGLWAVRGVTRIYFGQTGDTPVAGDYNGFGFDAPAVFRSTSGLWAVRGVTRVYFGSGTDEPVPGDYSGNGQNNFAIFRDSSSLWAVRNLTRVYFGSSSDTLLPAGKAPRRLVKTGQQKSYAIGDDGSYRAGTGFNFDTAAPDPSQPGQVVTLDPNTGLMWASDGNQFGCYNGGTLSWSGALAWAEVLDFAGYTDWRLPNIRELQSLVAFGQAQPTIRKTRFPNTKTDLPYWSSTSFHQQTSSAWFTEFSEGSSGYCAKDYSSLYVRAVRGGI